MTGNWVTDSFLRAIVKAQLASFLLNKQRRGTCGWLLLMTPDDRKTCARGCAQGKGPHSNPFYATGIGNPGCHMPLVSLQ